MDLATLVARSGDDPRDVEAERASAAQLARSDERFRLAMDASAIGMCLVAPDGTFMRVNPALCAMLGRSQESLLTATWQQLTHPDDVDIDQSLVNEVLTGRRDSYRLVKRYLRPDGSVVWGDLSVACIRTSDGDVEQFISQIVDITVAQQVHQQLETAEARFRLLAENASDLVIFADLAGRVQWVSPSTEQTLGWSSDGVLGTSMSALLEHAGDHRAAGATEGFDGTSVLPDHAEVESAVVVPLTTSDGRLRWFSGQQRPMTSAEGKPIGMVLGLRDVTELVEARAASEEREERRRAMLDSLLDPHVLIEAVRDDAGNIVDFEYLDANRAACDYVNLRKDQLIGMRLLELLPDQVGSGMFDLYVDALNRGTPLVLDDYAYPHELIGAERRYDIRAVAVRDGLSFTWRDVTERHETARRLAESEAHFRLLAENSSDVVLHLVGSTIDWVSPSLSDALGWTPGQWVGRSLTSWVHRADHPRLRTEFAAIESGSRMHARFRLQARDGSYHWVDATAHRFIDDSGKADGIAASFALADEQVAAEEALARRAQYDDLTGLLNRAALFERLRQLLPLATGDQPAVVFCDLDNFKNINDTHGHHLGDLVISTAADHIRRMLGPTDFAARLGGDEFLLVMPEVSGLEGALARAEQVHEHCNEPHDYQGMIYRPLMSIGVTLARPGDEVDDVIARADRAMYAAKRAGGNRVVALV